MDNKLINLKKSAPAIPAPNEKLIAPMLHWKALEFHHEEKSHAWYWGIGIAGGAVVFFSLITGNFLFAILAVLVVFLVIMYQARGPKEYEFTIVQRGVQVGKRLFQFVHLESFWIFEHENGHSELSIKSKKTLLPHIKIPLGDKKPAEVRGVLQVYLPEVHQEESLIDVLARVFGL